MATETLTIVIRAQDQASGVFEKLSQESSTLSQNLSRGFATGIGFAAFQQATQLVGQAFTAAKDAVIGFNSSMEQSRIGWSTMLGSAAQAETMLNNLRQFARETPFSFPEVEQAARRFAAMGIAAGDILPLMRSVGEAAAAVGGGSDAINRISLALGQMQTRTRVTAEDMQQLTEVGVPAWRILAEATGQSVAQIQDSVTKGQVASDVMIRAFQRFADVHWAQLLDANTFQTIVSNIGDSLTQLLGDAFEPLFLSIKDLAKSFSDFVNSEGAKEFAVTLRTIQIATRDFLTGASQSGPVLKVLEAAVLGLAATIAVSLVPALLAAAAAAAPWLALGVALTGVALVIIENWDAVSQATQELVTNVTTSLGRLAEFLGTALGQGFDALVTEWTTGWTNLANLTVQALNFIGTAWATFWNSDLGEPARDGFNNLLQMAQQAWPEFAREGIENLRRLAAAWNAFVGGLQALKDVGVFEAADPLGLSVIAGRTINVDQAMQDLGATVQNVSSVTVQAGQQLGKFVAEQIPAAVAKAIDVVRAAGGDLGDLIPKLIAELQSRVGQVGQGFNDTLRAGASNFGTTVQQATKPVIDELRTLLAEQVGGPAADALEEQQRRMRRNELLLSVPGLLAPEQRNAVIVDQLAAARHLAGAQLAAFDAETNVIGARREQQANDQQRRIDELLRQASGAPNPSVGGVTAQGTPIAVGAGAAAGAAASAIPQKMDITIGGGVTVSGDWGTIAASIAGNVGDQVFLQLVEANGQAQLPPVVIQSGVRRPG